MWWDLIQQGQLSDLEDQVEAQQKEIAELKANVERLSEWVLFLIKDGRTIVPTVDPISDEEKV